jgi:DNA polymerase-3 subunit epsilon
MPIPAEATAIHGITNEKVATAPTFKEIATEVFGWLKGCDLAGYNSDRFDIPLLAEEMLRAEIDVDFKKHKTIDVQTIFHKMEQRTLIAAYKFYCSKSLDDAHSASADTLATFEVLKAQIERYSDLENDVDKLSEFTTRHTSVDFAGFIRRNKEDEPIFGFGKHKGKTVVEVLQKEPGYFGWILEADFPLYTKKVLTAIRLNTLNNS